MNEGADCTSGLAAGPAATLNAMAEAASVLEPVKDTEEQCPICWCILCEPVAWPGCSHYCCLVCALRVRQRPKPTCPLCRTPAPRARRAAELQVDTKRAGQVRRSVGYSRYELQRRELWVEAAAVDARGGLGELPLFCMGTWHFPAGSHQRLRLFEPRYQEMIRRALAPGGDRRFAVVLRPAEFEVGARGRVCEIVESEQGPDGEWHVVVEGGVAFQITELKSEELQPGAPPLYQGALEEVEEEELSNIGEAWTPLVAANEMVAILGILGQHLRTMRHRRQPSVHTALDLEEAEDHGERESLDVEEQLLPEAFQAEQARLRLPGWRMAGGSQSDEGAGRAVMSPPEQEDVGAMVNLLTAYRQIIGEMDRLLIQASRTAERLGLSDGDSEAPRMPASFASPPTTPARTPEAESIALLANAGRRTSVGRQQREGRLMANATAGSLANAGSDSGTRGSAPRQATTVTLPQTVEAAAQTLSPSSSSVRASSRSAVQESAMLIRSADHGSLHSQLATSTSAPSERGTMGLAASRSSAPWMPGTPTRRPSSSTWSAGSPLGSGRRPATPTRGPGTPTRGPSTPTRSLWRASRSSVPGDVGDDRGITQAEALRLRGSSRPWRSPLSIGEVGSASSSLSMSEVPLSPESAASPASSASNAASSGTRRTRRPRHAVFSQAARSTFPGRRSNE